MSNNKEYAQLVEQARLGSRQSLDVLAQKVRGPLYAYVYRIVLKEDISQDIVQESMLEMFNNINNLEQAEHFWPWLCKIAFNKTRRHYKNQIRRKTVSITNADTCPQDELSDGQTGLTALVAEELKQIVFDAMRELKPKHRAVLAMRCYEEMQYSQIAQLMDSSELTVRVMFYRAKEALHKHLSQKGFGKGFMLSALALFGRMTAPSEAAAPSITVTAAATKVGAAAALVGVATSKTAVVSLAAAAFLTAGAVLLPMSLDKAITWVNNAFGSLRQKLAQTPPARVDAGNALNEYWYYYPEKTNGPVMRSLIKRQSQGGNYFCQWLEDKQANYYFDKQTNSLCINNYRMCRDNLELDAQEQNEKIESASNDSNGLLVIVECTGSGSHTSTSVQYNVLDEEYFQHNWPAGTNIIDNRDAMHKRGWTYFRITGHINGEKVSGTGRIPFVYAAYSQYRPWLKLNVADRIEITDSTFGAGIYNAGKGTFTTCPPLAFFKGLARPWMGLHTIDAIRRDAAELNLTFEKKCTSDNSKADVTLAHPQYKIVYTVDMKKDVIEKITILTNTGEKNIELNFSYLDDVEHTGAEFAGPARKDYGTPQPGASSRGGQENPDRLWLLRLAEGGLN